MSRSGSVVDRVTRWRFLALAAVLVLGGCTGSAAPSATTPASSATTPAAAPSGTTAAPTAASVPASPPAPAGRGCPATGATVPDGAASAPTVDLDGDGAPDTLWLSAGLPRILGVRTHSGAVFSVEFSSAAPQAAQAMGQRLADGAAIILLNTGRAVPLYAVVDCAIVATRNVQGTQYTFDLGFTGFGTGVACEDVGAGVQLVGLEATSTDGKAFDVTRTPIALAERGTRATNGRATTIARGVPPDDPAVVAAHQVTCADAPAPVVEP